MGHPPFLKSQSASCIEQYRNRAGVLEKPCSGTSEKRLYALPDKTETSHKVRLKPLISQKSAIARVWKYSCTGSILQHKSSYHIFKKSSPLRSMWIEPPVPFDIRKALNRQNGPESFLLHFWKKFLSIFRCHVNR